MGFIISSGPGVVGLDPGVLGGLGALLFMGAGPLDPGLDPGGAPWYPSFSLLSLSAAPSSARDGLASLHMTGVLSPSISVMVAPSSSTKTSDQVSSSSPSPSSVSEGYAVEAREREASEEALETLRMEADQGSGVDCTKG